MKAVCLSGNWIGYSLRHKHTNTKHTVFSAEERNFRHFLTTCSHIFFQIELSSFTYIQSASTSAAVEARLIASKVKRAKEKSKCQWMSYNYKSQNKGNQSERNGMSRKRDEQKRRIFYVIELILIVIVWTFLEENKTSIYNERGGSGPLQRGAERKSK